MGAFNNELKFLRVFSELRNNYSNIETAIEVTSVSTGLDLEELLGLLSATGVYVLPGSEEEDGIRRFIDSAPKTTAVDELARAVGFNFCICDDEAKRLVEKWFKTGGDSEKV